jgi:hypothetical protein
MRAPPRCYNMIEKAGLSDGNPIFGIPTKHKSEEHVL